MSLDPTGTQAFLPLELRGFSEVRAEHVRVLYSYLFRATQTATADVADLYNTRVTDPFVLTEKQRATEMAINRVFGGCDEQITDAQLLHILGVLADVEAGVQGLAGTRGIAAGNVIIEDSPTGTTWAHWDGTTISLYPLFWKVGTVLEETECFDRAEGDARNPQEQAGIIFHELVHHYANTKAWDDIEQGAAGYIRDRMTKIPTFQRDGAGARELIQTVAAYEVFMQDYYLKDLFTPSPAGDRTDRLGPDLQFA
jgi:hypothetical protein